MIWFQLLYCLAPLLYFQPGEKVKNPEYQRFLEDLYKGQAPAITVEDLQDADGEEIYLLDTREPQEYQISHLKYARQVGNIWFDMRDVYDIPKEGLIVVYCTIGNRSSRIAEKMINAGYSRVYFLYGGMVEWVNQGNPVYTGNEIQTPQVYLERRSWGRWLEKGKAIY